MSSRRFDIQEALNQIAEDKVRVVLHRCPIKVKKKISDGDNDDADDDIRIVEPHVPSIDLTISSPVHVIDITTNDEEEEEEDFSLPQASPAYSPYDSDADEEGSIFSLRISESDQEISNPILSESDQEISNPILSKPDQGISNPVSLVCQIPVSALGLNSHTDEDDTIMVQLQDLFDNIPSTKLSEETNKLEDYDYRMMKKIRLSKYRATETNKLENKRVVDRVKKSLGNGRPRGKPKKEVPSAYTTKNNTKSKLYRDLSMYYPLSKFHQVNKPPSAIEKIILNNEVQPEQNQVTSPGESQSIYQSEGIELTYDEKTQSISKKLDSAQIVEPPIIADRPVLNPLQVVEPVNEADKPIPNPLQIVEPSIIADRPALNPLQVIKPVIEADRPIPNTPQIAVTTVTKPRIWVRKDIQLQLNISLHNLLKKHITSIENKIIQTPNLQLQSNIPQQTLDQSALDMQYKDNTQPLYYAQQFCSQVVNTQQWEQPNQQANSLYQTHFQQTFNPQQPYCGAQYHLNRGLNHVWSPPAAETPPLLHGGSTFGYPMMESSGCLQSLAPNQRAPPPPYSQSINKGAISDRSEDFHTLVNNYIQDFIDFFD